MTESPALRRIRAEARIAQEGRASRDEFAAIVRACIERYAQEARDLAGVGALYLYYRPSTDVDSGELRIGPDALDGEAIASPERLSMWTSLPQLTPWVAERARRLPILRRA